MSETQNGNKLTLLDKLRAFTYAVLLAAAVWVVVTFGWSK